jgi:hypothetical protein
MHRAKLRFTYQLKLAVKRLDYAERMSLALSLAIIMVLWVLALEFRSQPGTKIAWSIALWCLLPQYGAVFLLGRSWYHDRQRTRRRTSVRGFERYPRIRPQRPKLRLEHIFVLQLGVLFTIMGIFLVSPAREAGNVRWGIITAAWSFIMLITVVFALIGWLKNTLGRESVDSSNYQDRVGNNEY